MASLDAIEPIKACRCSKRRCGRQQQGGQGREQPHWQLGQLTKDLGTPQAVQGHVRVAEGLPGASKGTSKGTSKGPLRGLQGASKGHPRVRSRSGGQGSRRCHHPLNLLYNCLHILRMLLLCSACCIYVGTASLNSMAFFGCGAPSFMGPFISDREPYPSINVDSGFL